MATAIVQTATSTGACVAATALVTRTSDSMQIICALMDAIKIIITDFVPGFIIKMSIINH